MIVQFTTYSQADQADLYIGGRLQTEGQKEQLEKYRSENDLKDPPDNFAWYKCERWSGVTDNGDSTASIIYHEYLEAFKEETGINFDSSYNPSFLLSQAAKGAAIIIQTTQTAIEDANAIQGDAAGQLKIIQETKEKLSMAIESFSP